jgi:hypothetical protein
VIPFLCMKIAGTSLTVSRWSWCRLHWSICEALHSSGSYHLTLAVLTFGTA